MSNTYGFNIPSFFGGDSPGDLTYEQLLMRRKIAAALAARQRGFPKNLGEGLTYFGEALGDRLEMMRLAQAEKRHQQANVNLRQGLLPGQAQPAAPAAPAAPAGVAPPPRAYTPPVPTPARAPTAAIDEEDPSRPSALDLAPPSPIDGGGAPSPLAGPRQRVMEMETLDPAVANEMDRAAVYPQGAAPPSVESAEPPRQPSPEWQRLQDYQESQGRPRQQPPAPALMRPRLDATGEPTPSEPPTPQNYGPPVSEGGSSVDQFKAASAKLESGGRYDLLGPPVRTGGGIHRAYGKYQVMDFNIPKWTEKYLGQRMSPEEFLRDPQAQERVYEGEFGRLAEKYGPEGASRAWIGGEGGMNNLNRRAIDASGRPIGLSVGEYGRQFANAVGEQPTRAAAAEGVRPPTRPAAPSAVTRGDLDSDVLLAEAVGVAGGEPPARPQVAAYAPDTASDAPSIGLPMGYLPDMADTVQARRGAISGRLPQPPMTAPVPGPAGGEPAAPAQRLAQMPALGGSPAIPDASMFSPLPTPGAQPQPPPMAPAPAAQPPGMAPAPPPGAMPPLAARPPGIAPAPPPGAVPPPAAQPPGIAPAPPVPAMPGTAAQPTYTIPPGMTLKPMAPPPEAPRMKDPGPEEIRAMHIMNHPQADERTAGAAKTAVEFYQAQRKRDHDLAMEVWKQNRAVWNEQDKLTQQHILEQIAEQQKQQYGLPKQVAETEHARAQAEQIRQTIARTAGDEETKRRLGGMEPHQFYPILLKERDAAQTASTALTDTQAIVGAVKAGAITGTLNAPRYQIERFKEYLLNNPDSQRLVFNTEQMQVLSASERAAMVRQLNPAGAISNLEQRMAGMATGLDPSLAKGTILEAAQRAIERDTRTINDYEQKTHSFVRGTPAEPLFTYSSRPTAPDGAVQLLLENASNSRVRLDFDEKYGRGAAQLEINRARRSQERGR